MSTRVYVTSVVMLVMDALSLMLGQNHLWQSGHREEFLEKLVEYEQAWKAGK